MFAGTLFTTCLIAAAAALKVSTSVDSKQTCMTQLQDVASSPASLPTSTSTTVQTVHSTITTCGTSSTVTTTITPAPVTVTRSFNGTNNDVADITAPANDVQACSETNTVSASVVTVYTGSYNGTVAKRTASPLDGRGSQSRNGRPRSPLNFNMFMNFRQGVTGAKQKPVCVDCVKQITTYLITTTTIAEEPATETVTAEASTIFITQANKVAAQPTAPVPITSTITAPGAVNTTALGACTALAAPSTTTQHLKCAPTNLISSVNGYGIGQTGGSSNTTRKLGPGRDASACCQLCVDTDNCAASQDDPDAGNCFLWITTPSCGLGFQYSDGGQDLAPGAGFLVQTGCGTIEGVESFE